MPTKKKTTANKQQKPRTTADLLQLGRSKRGVGGSTDNRGWHRWGGEWSAEQMGQLVRSNAAFRTFVYGIAAERAPGVKARSLDAAANAFERWAKDRPSQAGATVVGLLEELRGNYVNALRIHPLDVMKLVKMLACGWEERRGSGGAVCIGEASRMARMSPGSDNAAYVSLQTLRRLRGGMLKGSRFGVLQNAGRMLYSMNYNVLLGFYQSGSVKPWRLGASPANVFGVEITMIEWKVAAEFDDKGKPTKWNHAKHPTAALAVERAARNDAELRGGLAVTPAGRLWLVWHAGKLGLATDRKPKRPLFLTDTASAVDARIRSVFESTHPKDRLTGLTV